jgi:hypothetical protein
MLRSLFFLVKTTIQTIRILIYFPLFLSCVCLSQQEEKERREQGNKKLKLNILRVSEGKQKDTGMLRLVQNIPLENLPANSLGAAAVELLRPNLKRHPISPCAVERGYIYAIILTVSKRHGINRLFLFHLDMISISGVKGIGISFLPILREIVRSKILRPVEDKGGSVPYRYNREVRLATLSVHN